jgi:hypothetical protein
LTKRLETEKSQCREHDHDAHGDAHCSACQSRQGCIEVRAPECLVDAPAGGQFVDSSAQK